MKAPIDPCRVLAVLGITLGAALLAAGCGLALGSTPADLAETVIKTRLADIYGLEATEATCEEPANQEAGTTFTCSSPTDLGVIEWQAILTEEATVDVQPINLLDAPRVTNLEQTAAQLLTDEVGIVVAGEAFDCGDLAVLGAEQVLACSVVDPASGEVYDATLEITDLNANAFTVQVANTPR